MKINYFLLCFFISMPTWAQQIPSISALQDGIHHWNLVHPTRNYERYRESDYEKIADNLIAYQNPDGGWLKNMDWLGILNIDSIKANLDDKQKYSTLDNRNTFSQIEYLADVYVLSMKEKYKTAVEKGLHYLLSTQKDNGGWRGWDVDAITFNDDVTTGVLEMFRNIIQKDSSFLWLNSEILNKIEEAYKKGIDLVLKTQYVQNGVKTVWAQQYDNVTMEPVKARSFELPALTAWESTEIVMLLMGINNPSEEIIQAIENAIHWFNKSKIEGVRIERINLKAQEIINHEYPFDIVVVEDKTALPIWSRFYDLENNKPFMVKRSGEKVWKLEDVNPERRTGYDWYGYWPVKALEMYSKWKVKVEK